MSAAGEDGLARRDDIYLDWQLTLGWPGDETMSGYVPPVGEHVLCYRPSDGKTQCGVVDDNRMGLFLTRCHGGRVVMTAARWNVRPLTPTNSCRTAGTPKRPREGDEMT